MQKHYELPDVGLNLIVYSVCILQEAAVFAKEQDFEEKEDLHKVALLMTKLPKQNVSRPRIVIITQGAGPIILAQGICIASGISFMYIKDVTRSIIILLTTTPENVVSYFQTVPIFLF